MEEPRVTSNTPSSTSTTPDIIEATQGSQGSKRLLVTLCVIAAIAITGYWLISTYIFPSEFKPITLNQRENNALEIKINNLEKAGTNSQQIRQQDNSSGELKPQPYSEKNAKRTIHFSERELNALLASNTDLAPTVAINLSNNLASVKILIHVDPDFPILGGKIVRVSAGVEIAYRNGSPIVALKGVSAWGVPLPNAWLGNIKNVDLVHEYHGSGGFWAAFAAGVKSIEIKNGELQIQLKE